MKKNRRICMALVSLVMVLLMMTLEINAADEFKSETRQGVVMILSQFPYEGRWAYASGTGFFVGIQDEKPQYIVTNYHVISNFVEDGAGNGDSRLYVFYDDDDYEEVFVQDYNETKDLAILHINKPTDKRIPLKLSKVSQDSVGSSVYAIGFPGCAEYASSITSYGVDDTTVTKGTIGRLVTQEGTGRRVIQTDASIQSGNSGGPLVNADGNVIGVNTFTLEENGSKLEGMNYAVSIEELIPMLNNSDVKFAMEEAANEGSNMEKGPEGQGPEGQGPEGQGPEGQRPEGQGPEGQEPEGWTPKENQAPGQSQDVNESVPSQSVSASEDKGGNTSLYVILSVVAAIMIAAVIVIIVMAKKKKPQQTLSQVNKPASPVNTQYVPSAAPVHRQDNPRICSVSPCHRGKEITVGASLLMIGRDPSVCKLVYESKTPGVSGRHCTLSWNAARREFVLTDVGSSYGTFVGGGQKLVPNKPYYLKPGESFYVGDWANEIKTMI